jgi:hypothetical protein
MSEPLINFNYVCIIHVGTTFGDFIMPSLAHIHHSHHEVVVRGVVPEDGRITN